MPLFARHALFDNQKVGLELKRGVEKEKQA